MESIRRCLLVSIAACLPALANAQAISPISAEFTPDSVALGATSVVFEIWNNSGQTWTTGACQWFKIHPSDASGRPDTSEIIEHTFACTLQLVITPPGASLRWTWDLMDRCPGCGAAPLPPFGPPAPVPAGKYWFHAEPQGLSEWFPFEVHDVASETLTSSGPAQIGAAVTYATSAPNQAGSAYALVLAFSANNAVGSVPGLFEDLSLAGPIFDVGGGLANLDAQGLGTRSFTVPNDPSIIDESFHLQSLILNLGPSPLFVTTNSVVRSVRP